MSTRNLPRFYKLILYSLIVLCIYEWEQQHHRRASPSLPSRVVRVKSDSHIWLLLVTRL